MGRIGSLSPSSCPLLPEDSGLYPTSCSALALSRPEVWFWSSQASQCVSDRWLLCASSQLKRLSTVVSALELTAQNIMCGSVRMVYAVIYTLFLVSLPLASH